jgi:hypothetical protein
LALRVKDVDFGRGQLTVRDPKWKHDRTTMLPASLTADMHEQIVHSRLVHQEDLACGWGETWLPDAIARKFPSAARDSRSHWVFPATRRWRDRDPLSPMSDRFDDHHRDGRSAAGGGNRFVMTCPLVRSMSLTRRHTPGRAPALCRDALQDVTHSTASVGILSDRFLISVRSLAIAAPHHFSAARTPTANENRRLKTHLPSAVPFNSLFPHS